MKKAILVVSFGTSYQKTREKTIEAIEKNIQVKFAEYSVRRAFTSQKIISKMKKQEGIEIDTVSSAIEKLAVEGFTEVIIQPTHIMAGIEYHLMLDDIAPFANKIPLIRYGMPMLTNEQDYKIIIKEITAAMKDLSGSDTAVVLMGHGTEHQANQVYHTLNQMLDQRGYDNFKVATVEASPDIQEVLKNMKEKSYKKVVLIPFMIVAGDHAINDMAGEDEHSWKNIFRQQGYEVTCCLKGLGEYPGIQQLFVDHVKNAKVLET